MNSSEKTSLHHRRSASEIKSIIEQHSASGLTVAAFCGEQGLNMGTFHTWKKRYRTSEGIKEQNRSFVKLQVRDNIPILFAEVNGIRLYQAVSASFLKALVA